MAVVVSAILLATVARLLYSKFAPAVRIRVDRLAAQRAVLALPSRGVAIDADELDTPGSLSEIESVADRWRAAFNIPLRRAHSASTYRSSPPELAGLLDADRLVYVGPLTNAAGVERIVCVRVSTFPGERFRVSPGFSVDVRERLGWLGREESVGSLRTIGTFLPATRPLHLDAPIVDAENPRRLLFTGSADAVPFAYELLLDAHDAARCFDLHATTQRAR